ncbi:MAG: AgmX/PglI C-terminal domain-containing protein, partial [Gammaproteobacteria bacterium]|nr:AgmX/PglI C-terminal domain-containing protein [Gammaproteobacteria bacterium]
ELEKKVEDSAYEIGYLKEDLELTKLEEAESKNDYIVNREYTPDSYREMVMPWSNKGEDEKRFKKYLLLAFLYSILFALVIPYIELPIPDKEEVVEVPERIAKFIKKKQPEPKPKKQTQLAEKKKPSVEEKVKAREKAAKTGLLAFKNNFADLMDDVNDAKLGANAKLSDQGTQAKSTSRSLVLAQAQSGSGGINSSALSRDVGIAGGKIGSVKFSRVTSEIGTAAAGDRPLSSGPGPSRTDEEIQIVFDRYKAALYRIYNRELRKNPTLQGKMVLRITILPDGKVSKAKVESSDLDSALLSKKIVERVTRFNFGAKKDVPTITILYPIDFLPAT